MTWEFETLGPDGQCKLFGVNIFDYDWKAGKREKVKDPIYHQDHTFESVRWRLTGRTTVCRWRVLQLRMGILFETQS